MLQISLTRELLYRFERSESRFHFVIFYFFTREVSLWNNFLQSWKK